MKKEIYKKSLKSSLGKTGLNVSKICFGSLTMGPLQRNMSWEEGANLIKYGLERGINFIDTAELYETYGHISKALESIKREDLYIFTKSYAYDIKTAQESLSKALKELNTDYVDGFLLHEQESEHTLRGHYEATEFFLKMKEKGYIRAFGASTHSVKCVNACAELDYIDVIHPLINKTSIGILDGTNEEMDKAIKKAKSKGIGIYSMKPLGGGNLIKSYDDALDYVLDIKEIDSVAIGMQSKEEIDMNVLKFSRLDIPQKLYDDIQGKNRELVISEWCIGCKACENMCSQKAIKVIKGKAVVDKEKCVLCSYCASYCKEFCIKII